MAVFTVTLNRKEEGYFGLTGTEFAVNKDVYDLFFDILNGRLQLSQAEGGILISAPQQTQPVDVQSIEAEPVE